MPATEAEMMEACMKAATPGAHHQKLEAFAGTWKAKVRHWMQPGADPHESTGTMTNTWVLGNRFLKQDYQDDAGQFEGTGYWGYNNITGRYEGFWIDGMTTGMSHEVGTVDGTGKVWEMSGETEFPTAGQKMSKRSVITLESADRHVMEMYYGGPDGGEFKALVIEYTR
jgi:hypothetical protein